MPSQKTKFIVGLFLTGGTGIILLAVIWLGTSRYLEEGQFYVTYFNESVQGLDKDSPVKYRGVAIGRVLKITVAPDSKLIKVIVKIESRQPLSPNLVAQLKVVGITGSMFVELDQKKEGEPDRSPKLTFPSEYPIIASQPSDIGQIIRSVDEILSKVKALDLEGISDRVESTLDKMELTMADANVKGLSRKAASSLDSMNRILDNEKWGTILASVETAARSASELISNVNSTVAKADRLFTRVEGITADSQGKIETALDEFGRAMVNVNLLLEKGTTLASETDATFSHLRQHLLVTMQNLERASENLNRLSEILADQPSQLLFGEPPIPRKVEPELPTGKGE
jgi:phospholipid/cholesterol/gamma-HCH transport system substrate-binding protein